MLPSITELRLYRVEREAVTVKNGKCAKAGGSCNAPATGLSGFPSFLKQSMCPRTSEIHIGVTNGAGPASPQSARVRNAHPGSELCRAFALHFQAGIDAALGASGSAWRTLTQSLSAAIKTVLCGSGLME
jgi:hypothetical protein